MTKDNQRQGMSELLAKQRAGPPITPSEAARQRRSGRRVSATGSAGTELPEDRPGAGTQPSEDLPSAEEAPAHERQATGGPPAGATAPQTDVQARMPVKASGVAGRARGSAAGRPRSARSADGRGDQVKDRVSAAAPNVTQAMPGRVRRAVAQAASNKGALLTAACAVAVPVIYWLVAARWRHATALAAKANVRARLRDKAGEVTGKIGPRAAGVARSAWPARRP